MAAKEKSDTLTLLVRLSNNGQRSSDRRCIVLHGLHTACIKLVGEDVISLFASLFITPSHCRSMGDHVEDYSFAAD